MKNTVAVCIILQYYINTIIFFSSMFFSGKRGAAAMKFHRFHAYVTGVLPQTVFLQL